MPTHLIRDLNHVLPAWQGGVITIGNFDGVHLGHQQLIAAALAKARALGVPALVITFEPHPQEFFSRQVTVPRLTRFREKFSALRDRGVDAVVLLKFNQRLASMPASAFITWLHAALKPVHVIVGDDFHFGRGREGDVILLSSMGQTLGFSSEALPTVMLDHERISSTRVRKALAAGDHVLTQRLLGRPYAMLGRVRHGDQLGRQFGFPTANIFLHRALTPVHGIYTVFVHGIGDHPLPGVANVGTRPTVGGTRTLLEVHLLDFNQDIYGRDVCVEFCHKMREEERYPTIELLKEQIARDVAEARQWFVANIRSEC